MKRFALIFIVFFICFGTAKLNATTGCLVGSSLYTSTNGGTYPGLTYYDTSPSQNASGYCLRAGTSTTSCQLRTWYWFFWSYGATGIRGDYGADNPPAYCPIDDYIAFLLLPIAGLGYAIIRRNLV